MVSISELRDRPIFICGHPKAGTSLLRAILDSHPQLIVYPEETIFFRRFLPQAQGLDCQEQVQLAEKLLIHIFKWSRANPDPSQVGFPERDYSQISFDAVRATMQRIVESRWQHAGDTLSAAVLAYGQASGQITRDTQFWIEKSPYNEYFAEQIYSWWPAARCIHILRDPRDNYVSYQRKHVSWSAEFFAANWSRSTCAGMHNQQQFGAPRYLLLRYEDLVQSPDIYLHQIVDFLGIDWDASLTDLTRAGEQWQGNSMFGDQFQSISAAAIGRWRENLIPDDAAVIELMARPLMQAWQYDPGTAHHLKARWRASSWPLRRRLARFSSPE